PSAPMLSLCCGLLSLLGLLGLLCLWVCLGKTNKSQEKDEEEGKDLGKVAVHAEDAAGADQLSSLFIYTCRISVLPNLPNCLEKSELNCQISCWDTCMMAYRIFRIPMSGKAIVLCTSNDLEVRLNV